MEAIIENNNFFSNIDFFHNLRDFKQKDLKEMNIRKTKKRGDILTPKQFKIRLLESNRPSDVKEKKINKAFGTAVPISNYDKKVMGFFGFILHQLDLSGIHALILHHLDPTLIKDEQKKLIREAYIEYNRLLQDQKTLSRSKYLTKLIDYSNKFLTNSFYKGIVQGIFGKEAINTKKLHNILPSRLRELQRDAELFEGREKGRKVKRELENEKIKRDLLQNTLNNMLNENKRQKNQQYQFKNEQNIIPEQIEKQVDKIAKEDLILKALREQKSSGTVASVGGFLGITTASIIARIIGNSTANYLSPQNKSNVNVTVGNKNDDRNKLIELIQKQRATDTERLENDIEHLKDRIEHRKTIKNIDKRNKPKRSKMHSRFNKKDINLINIINRL